MHFSNPIDANIARKALKEGEALYTAADCGLSYLGLLGKFGEQEIDNNFWLHTRAALMGSFVINWCKLFGSDVQDPYWKQTTIEQKDFREAIYAATGFNYQSWEKYRKAMSELRATVVDHLNPYYNFNDLPDFSPAIEIIKVCHQWLRDVVEEFQIEPEGPVAELDYFKEVDADIQATLNKF